MINEKEILNKINKLSMYKFLSLNDRNSKNYTPLMHVCVYNRVINLSNNEIWWLIKNSDLLIKSNKNNNVLTLIAEYNKTNNLNLTNEQLWWIKEKSNFSNFSKEDMKKLELLKVEYEKDNINNVLMKENKKKIFKI